MGFAIPPKQIQKANFKLKDIHKKIGQIIVMPPCDSDLQEGGPICTQVYLVTEKKGVLTWWLLFEEDEE